MSGDAHVRICESLGVQFPRATRLFVRMQGRTQYLWRAVDEDGDVIDILVQPRRNRRAAIRFFRKLLKTQGALPRCLITDKLPSYHAACRTLIPSVMHCTAPYANNRVEVSHQPTRHRERQMRGFKSIAHPQRFASVHGVRPESLPRRPAPPTSRSSPRAPHPSVRRMERGDVCFVSSRPSSDLGRRPGPRPAS